MADNYMNLFAAIVRQAVLDYCYAREYLPANHRRYEAIQKKRKRGEPLPKRTKYFVFEYGKQQLRYKEVIEFFEGDMCYLLCGIEGKRILKELENVSYSEVKKRMEGKRT